MTSINEAIRREVQEAVAPLHVKIDRLLAALAAREQGDTLDSAGAARLLGKSPAALRVFLARNRSCPRQKVGARLVFSRTALMDWIGAQKRRAQGGAA